VLFFTEMVRFCNQPTPRAPELTRNAHRLIRYPQNARVSPPSVPFSQVFAAYTRALERHPLLTKVATSTVLFGAGDFMSQKLEGKQSIDAARLARMAAWGAIFTPFAHVWYNALDKMIPGSGATVVASKVVSDQVRKGATKATAVAL
jgi:hypothetical protein